MDRTVELTLKLLLASFAVFRVAELIALDDGPFAVFQRLRNALGVLASRGSGKRDVMWSLAELVRCPYCVGFWLSAIASYFLAESILSFFVYWLAIAGIQAFLEALVNPRLAE